jgi:hypothetical protein
LIVSIHQPNFFPWLGYFHKLLRSDVFVLFDDVQIPMGKNFVTRVLIKGVNDTQYIHPLTLPAPADSLIMDIQMDKTEYWRKKLLKTIRFNYQSAPCFKEIFSELEQLLMGEIPDTLAQFNAKCIQWASGQLGGQTKFVYSSEVLKGKEVSGAERIEVLLLELKATQYISGKGKGSLRYIQDEWFQKHGIELEMEEFSHPVYKQGKGEFVSGLSIIDLLFNHGKEARQILLGESIHA